MRTPASRSARLLFFLFPFSFFLVFCGCQPAKYRVTGTVTRDGKALEWETERGVLLVVFIPLDYERDRARYRADTDGQAGAFTIAAIPAGKYRVLVQQMDPSPKEDLLKFAFTVSDSPLIREVTGAGRIDIDLPRDLPKSAPAGPAKGPRKKS